MTIPRYQRLTYFPPRKNRWKKNQDVKDNLENCAVELATFNETAEMEIAWK